MFLGTMFLHHSDYIIRPPVESTRLWLLTIHIIQFHVETETLVENLLSDPGQQHLDTLQTPPQLAGEQREAVGIQSL